MNDNNSNEEIIDDVLFSKLSEQTESIYSSLVNVKYNARLPENVFVGYFLPHFSGQVPISDDTTVMADWISIAGTPMSEVDIVNPAGDTIFTVPSLFDTNIIDITKQDLGEPFPNIYSQYDLKNNHIPVIANSYLNEALSEKIDKIRNVDIITNDARWSEILTRYGIVNLKAVTSEIDDNPASDLEYD
jgi:hypothetical protein